MKTARLLCYTQFLINHRLAGRIRVSPIFCRNSVRDLPKVRKAVDGTFAQAAAAIRESVTSMVK